MMFTPLGYSNPPLFLFKIRNNSPCYKSFNGTITRQHDKI